MILDRRRPSAVTAGPRRELGGQGQGPRTLGILNTAAANARRLV
jgi:hypothetical protein